MKNSTKSTAELDYEAGFDLGFDGEWLSAVADVSPAYRSGYRDGKAFRRERQVAQAR
jgi:hypothetical protein